MEQNNQRNSRKRLNSLILLVAFTAVMLIVSTYAWFSAQKNVTLANLTGTVKVVEGLEISLDGNSWSQQVDFANYSAEQLANLVYAVDDDTLDEDAVHNIIPTELLPVSTLGYEDVGSTDITMLRGTNVNVNQLKNVVATSATTTVEGSEVATTAEANPDLYPGYYAIDFFLKDNTAGGLTTGTNVLQLNNNSYCNVLASGGDATTGLQNTPRVALALYTPTTVTGTMAGHETVVANLMGTNIADVAIWEPNAYDHVDYIVTNNNNIVWKADDKTGYLTDAVDSVLTGKYLGTEKIPTYALKQSATTFATGTTRILDIYNWSGAASGKTYYDDAGAVIAAGEGDGWKHVAKQATLQTTNTKDGSTGAVTNYKVTENYYNLISADQTDVTGWEKALNSLTTDDTGITLNTFDLPTNQISRLRMYVWLEGQDVDCINYASHGGGIEIDLGLIKDAGEE